MVAKRKTTTKPAAKKQPAKKTVKKPAVPKVSPEAKALAVLFHDTYEKLAPKYAYEARPDTRKFSPTSKNGKLMLAVAAEVLKHQPKPPEFGPKDFEQMFYALELEDFIQYTKLWNQNSLKLKMPNYKDYDQWLNYFKTLSPNVLTQLVTSGKDFLPTEAYSALTRWFDILSNPHRIDRIHQATMAGTPTKGKVSITELARKNDRMGVLCAVRDQLAEQMEKRATARDMASLAREMGDILDQIADLEKKAGPKTGTKAATLISDFDKRRNKRPGKNGGGARNTSFKSRVTIDDTEGSE